MAMTAREYYAGACATDRHYMFLQAMAQIESLEGRLEALEAENRRLHEIVDEWRCLYRECWRSAMRTWVNDKPLYDEEMDKQHREQERRDLEERHCPTFELETQNYMDESVG